jgi:tRNA threonylcarbamoyl adenosine modification protein (Sua5/YciO/YrdC/YwlC family)
MTQLLPPSEQVENVSQFFQIHPENPQARLIKQAVEIIRNGGVVIYPTDSSYAIGCQIGDKVAVERVRRLRGLDDKHNFALICSDLSQLGLFAKIDTGTFRFSRLIYQGRTPLFSTPPAKSRGCCCTRKNAPSACGCRAIRLPWRCWTNSASR